MGVDKKNGQIRVMDPAHGAYFPLNTALENWNTKNHNVNFLVVGIVRNIKSQWNYPLEDVSH